MSLKIEILNHNYKIKSLNMIGTHNYKIHLNSVSQNSEILNHIYKKKSKLNYEKISIHCEINS